MASNYEEICRQNREDYGKKGAKKSGDLAAGLYDDDTHFIYELLQNAEDALQRRGVSWDGPRHVRFTLNDTRLEVSHYGHPFTEDDVRSVCDISESTKHKDSIGRFGLGFKSVYKVSTLPEIHSGDEDFVIEEYVFPKVANKTQRDPEETQIFLPFRQDVAAIKGRIAAGLKGLGATSLLFLRNIQEISWGIAGGATGLYLRDDPEVLGDNVSRIKLIGQASGTADIDQDWLVFHREIGAARIQLAFSITSEKSDDAKWTLQPLQASPLVVFFPTAHLTNLGFYLQGPFQSTPSRDNIKSDDPWNHHLVEQAASLLVEAMSWLRDTKRLDINALRCLPLDRARFPEGGMFTPLFKAAIDAFNNSYLLPNSDDGYSRVEEAKLSRTSDLRDLFESGQLSVLYGRENTRWLTGEITQDRANDIRQFVTKELGVKEIQPRDIFPILTAQFLAAQSDEWLLQVYEFLNDQSALKPLLEQVPLIRLSDGTHVPAKTNGQLNAYLPSTEETGFPTVKRSVSNTKGANEFLESLGLHIPDPVDAVIRYILPKYQTDGDVDVSNYDDDIARIRSAFKTDSSSKRSSLIEELKKSHFVMAVSADGSLEYLERPGNIFIATDRLRKLFDGLKDISIVDNRYECLRGEEIREILEACGALRYVRPKRTPHESPWSDRLKALRELSGYPESSGQNDVVEDWELEGFPELIEYMAILSREERSERAGLIWESLGELEERRGRGIFEGSYTWTHRGRRRAPPFPAAFVRNLNNLPWVPDENGDLVPPGLISFERLGWKANTFLESKIVFKPDAIDRLAKEAEVDPATLDLIRRHKLTAADLTGWLAQRLGESQAPEAADSHLEVVPNDLDGSLEADEIPHGESIYDENMDLYGDGMPAIPESSKIPDEVDTELGHPNSPMAHRGGRNGGVGSSVGGESTSRSNTQGSPGRGNYGSDSRPPGAPGGRPFISYVAASPEAESKETDGLDHAKRMSIEADAIDFILESEPHLHRTDSGNPGFDLLERDVDGNPVRWIEVKAMTGSLRDRPVTVSSTQFDHALKKREAYWLYVVEFTATPAKRRILRIQDPAGNAKSFTFDHGWLDIAWTTPPVAARQVGGTP